MSEFVLHARHLPDFKNAQTVIRKVEAREIEMDGEPCRYFVSVGSDYITESLPTDFYLMEFLDLDPDDFDGLLEFQNEFGMIESCFDVRSNDSGALDFLTDRSSFRFEMSQAANADGVRIRNEFKARAATLNLRRYLLENVAGDVGEHDRAVSFTEVAACVNNLQTAIATLVDAAQFGIEPTDEDPHIRLLKLSAKYLSKYVDYGFESLAVARKSDVIFGGIDASVMSTVAAQCLAGICDCEHAVRYKTCPKCKKTFQYNRDTGKSSSKYCSKRCMRNNNNHGKDKRKA